MVVLVLLAGREGRLLEESDYSMDGLFSLESRSPGRPLLSPLLVRASMFSLPSVCALQAKPFGRRCSLSATSRRRRKAAGIDPWRRVGNGGRNSESVTLKGCRRITLASAVSSL